MTETKVTTESILEELSLVYENSDNPKNFHQVIDSPEAGTVVFIPAGYTKPGLDKAVKSRQLFHRVIVEEAIRRKKENTVYPLGTKDYWVELVPDPKNIFDKNAIKIIFRSNRRKMKDQAINSLDGADLGFVPKGINKKVLKNMSRIMGGYIWSVTMDLKRKIYIAQVSLWYGNESFINTSSVIKRFADILEE